MYAIQQMLLFDVWATFFIVFFPLVTTSTDVQELYTVLLLLRQVQDQECGDLHVLFLLRLVQGQNMVTYMYSNLGYTSLGF